MYHLSNIVILVNLEEILYIKKSRFQVPAGSLQLHEKVLNDRNFSVSFTKVFKIFVRVTYVISSNFTKFCKDCQNNCGLLLQRKKKVKQKLNHAVHSRSTIAYISKT